MGWDEYAENDMKEWSVSSEMVRNGGKWRNVINENRQTSASMEKPT